MARSALLLPVAVLVVLALLLPGAGSLLASSSYHPGLPRTELYAGPKTSSSALAVDDQVLVNASSLNCRQAPATNGTVFTVEPQYEQGLVVAGSVAADGYSWWEISWDNNYTGWSAQGNNGTVWIENITGGTIAFNRSAALSYAAEYWNVVTSDGYFWNGPDSYVSYAQGTSVVGLDGDDCAHFVSQVIGDQANHPGGGLDIPSRVPPTYGEPSAPDLGNDLLNWGWGVQVNGVQSMEPGDVINYEWNPPDGTWDHIAVYLGNGVVAAHTDSNWDANWTLGGAYAYRFIHILATTQGGSGVDHPEATLVLGPTSGPAPLTVSAVARTVGGSDDYTQYRFLWGDGTSTTSSTATATHLYNRPGSYSVQAEVTDSLGATGWSANVTATVTAALPPSLSVAVTPSPTSGAEPLPVAFTAVASGGSGTYTSYAWDFGDGASGTTTTGSASHTYTTTGTMDVEVTVMDSTGTTATSLPAHVNVSAGSNPTPLSVSLSASPTSGMAPFAVSFYATPSGGTGSYTSFLWNFGDGVSATTSSASASHTYTVPGTYSATVAVSDGTSEASSSPQAINVGTPAPLVPTLSASATSGTAPFTAELTLSISGGTSPYRVAWNFGDGTSTGAAAISGSSVELTHLYGTPGNFVVGATVVDGLGSSRSVNLTLAVSGPTGSPSSSPTSGSASPSLWASLTSAPTVYLLGALVVLGVLGVAVIAARRRRGSGETPEEPAPPAWPPPEAGGPGSL